MLPYPRIPNDNLRQAILRGDLEAVRGFVERGEIPEPTESQLNSLSDAHILFFPEDGIGSDESLLTRACRIGHVEVVRFLLEAGNYKEHESEYAAEAFAAMEYGRLEVFQLLCEYGLNADANEYSKHGESITDRAIRERRVEYLRALLPLEPVIYLDYEDEVVTPEEWENDTVPSKLEVAARIGDVEMVEFLLAAAFPLGEQSAHDYLEKARANAQKFQQWQDDEESNNEEEQQRQQLPIIDAQNKADTENFWCCLQLLLVPLVLGYGIWRLASWLGWGYILAGIAVLVIIGWGLAKK